jgi:hypothetical protein
MSVEEFRNHSDDDYLRWIVDHRHGYVLNIQRTGNPRDARLHRACCETITGIPARGNTFTDDWVKVCSLSLQALDSWAIRRTGSAVVRCGPVIRLPRSGVDHRVCHWSGFGQR